MRLDGSVEMNTKNSSVYCSETDNENLRQHIKTTPKTARGFFLGVDGLMNQRPFLPFDKHEKGSKGISF